MKPVIEEISAEVSSVEEKEVETPSETQLEGVSVESPLESPGSFESVVEDVTPEPEIKKHNDSKKVNLKMIIVITILSALVAAFVSGGVYVYLSGVQSSDENVEESPSPTPAPSESPEANATPEPAPVEISSYSVRVLNGSGAIGAASSGEDILVEAGFTVESTGNASNYDFESTVVQAKPSVEAEAVNKAKTALEEDDYEVEIGTPLAASSEYDIVVTIGSN